MRQLFWKEWHELRWLPLASALCTVLLIWGAKATLAPALGQPFQLRDTFLPLLATWMLFGLLAGAGLISQEAGSGGLAFLGSLPVSRHRLWWVKVTAALGAVLLCALASALVWAGVSLVLFRGAFFRDPLWQMPSLAVGLGLDGLVLLTFFAIALAASTFLDRPISAAIVALFGVVVYHSVILNVVSGSPGLAVAALALGVCLFAALSYWSFTRLGSKRVRQ